MCPVKPLLMSGRAGHVFASFTVFEMAARVLYYLSLITPPPPNPFWCPTSTQPFLPCALQDIYELKDQIQDVEGRYMQGLKELKVVGLELTACLLLFSGSNMASLTPPLPPASPLIPLCNPSRSPCNTTVVCLYMLLFAWSYFHFLFWSNSLVLLEMETLPQFSLVQTC